MKTQHALILWVVATLLFGGKAFAQNSSAQIKGQVLSSSAQALEYANVLLHKASDSTVVKLEYTQADVVRGRRVRIGEGCSIGRVEYSESLDALPGTVGEAVQTGE